MEKLDWKKMVARWLLAMAAGLVLCFTWLGSLFELRTSQTSVLLVMATLLLMTPTVFLVIERIFDWGEGLIKKPRKMRKKKK